MRKYISILVTLLVVMVLGSGLNTDTFVFAQNVDENKTKTEELKPSKSPKNDETIKTREQTESSKMESTEQSPIIDNYLKKDNDEENQQENQQEKDDTIKELKNAESKSTLDILDTSSVNIEKIIHNKNNLIKVPINIDEKSTIFLGGHEQFETVQRALRVQNKIYSTIIKEKLLNKEIITVSVIPKEDYFQVKINEDNVFQLKEQDFEVNNLEKEELIKNIKTSIEGIITSVNKASNKDIEQFLSQPVDFIKLFIFVIILIVVIELLLIIINKHKKKFIIANLRKLCIKKNRDTNYIETPNKEELPAEYEQKIELIANQVNLIFNFLLRSIQFVAIFFAFLKLLFFYPVTNEYATQAVTFIQSVIIIFKESIHEWFGTEESRGKLGAVFTILIISGFIIYVIKTAGSILSDLLLVLSDRRKRKSRRLITIIKMVSINIQLLIVIIGLVIALHEIGFEVTTILAGAGIAGIALSFGAQNLIKDVINGLFIIIEDQYGIHDTIKANGITGEVEKMTLRTTVLRDFFSGNIYIIPNGEINAVTVYTKDWANANLDISIAYKEDVDKAIKLIKETADLLKKEFPGKIIGEPNVLGLNNLNDSSVDIKLVMKTSAGEQWGVEREFRKRIKYVFDQNKIEIPFPHRTLYLHQSPQNQENKINKNINAEEHN